MIVLRNSVFKLQERFFHSTSTRLRFQYIHYSVSSSSCITNDKCTSIKNLVNMACKKTRPSRVLGPPSSVRGMKILDRDAFHKEIEVPCVVTSVEKIKCAVKILKPYFLKLRKFEPVQETDGKKIIFLNPVLTVGIIPTIKESLSSVNVDEILYKKLNLTYENWQYSDIFQAILPLDIPEGVSGFSIIGHILHLNLKPHVEEYKTIIGQIFLDKIPNIRTVVNKTTTIDNTFRNFQMEVLAGEHQFNVTVKENGFKFELDLSKVFWNPRLCTEHIRIIKKLRPGNVVFDVFAGVGPFAIPAAKMGCSVYANDLNPDSYEWLCHNAKLNKVDLCMKSYNLDGRNFITTVVKDTLASLWLEKKSHPVVHVIMNLPAFSFDFLDAFRNILPQLENDVREFNWPVVVVVHCYFFGKKGSLPDDTQSEIEKIFECEMKQHILEIVPVRAVAPSKNMMCVSFVLPAKVLFHDSNNVSDEPASKKIKVGH